MNPSDGNPYSFPPLPSNSPNVAEEQVTESGSSISRRATISAAGQISRETQRHLQQTSAALDAAYSRIRQVRRSLLELSESLPATISQPRLQGLEPELGDAFLLQPESQPSITELDGGRDARAMAPWNRVQPSGRSISETPIPGNRSHPMSTQQRMNYSSMHGDVRSIIRTGLANRDIQGDDGSTLLGRRVAARMAVAHTTGNTALATNQLMQGIRQTDEGTVNFIRPVTRSYEEDLEQVLHLMGERRRSSMAVPSRPTRNRTSIQAPSWPILQLSPQQFSQETSPSSSLASPDSSLNTQLELGPGSIPNYQQTTGPSDQLFLLSNFSSQNFPAPSTSNTPSRPLISDEPLSYVSSETVDPVFQSRSFAVPDSVPQGQNYVVHRRFDRNGEELVHNIIVDWEDSDSAPLSMPSANTPRRHRHRVSSPRHNFDPGLPFDPLAPPPPPPPPPPLPLSEDDTTSSSTSTSPNITPRRRGWARLDLDGNEIPSDDEEEVERIRTEYRIFAAQRAPGHSPLSHSPGMMPLPVILPSPPPELTIYRSIKPPVILRHEPSLSYPDDFVNPLPMPLSEMVDGGKTTKRKPPTLLPRHIIIAGR